MQVVCPGCHATYNVKDNQIPDSGTTAKCPRCGTAIPLMKEPSGSGPLEEADYNKTMVLFMPMPSQQDEQLEEVNKGLAGRDERVPSGVSYCVKFIDGDEAGREYRLGKTRTVLGRSNSDIMINDPEVSRQHAVVELYGDKAVIKDLQSTNGTFVNQLGVRVSFLSDGDEVQLGNTRMKFLVR